MEITRGLIDRAAHGGEIFAALKVGDRDRILNHLLHEISTNSCRVTTCLHRLETKALINEAGCSPHRV